MALDELTAISPLDGRYRHRVQSVASYFSEFALIRYRLLVEIEYFIALCELKLVPLASVRTEVFALLREIVTEFNANEAQRVKFYEGNINHDVKAIEYYLREKFAQIPARQWLGASGEKSQVDHLIEFIHFGLTSQDINNTAIPMMLRDCLYKTYLPALERIIKAIEQLAKAWYHVPMLAKTHGQPATPTTAGKEMQVFATRLIKQKHILEKLPFTAKFGGATGNLNAHKIAFPTIDWELFANQFVSQRLGLVRNFPTTQIDHYDDLAAIFDNLRRINVILIDLCRDCWLYISNNYFVQRVHAHEVGSSAMPHKVNPIDFENAEGNLGYANAIWEHLSNKLPVSRLQRDLTDSTVLRNIGVPLGHSLLAIQSIENGLSRIELNDGRLHTDLEENWVVISEAIQVILRREGLHAPYEMLKQLTRTNRKITKEVLHHFIDGLPVSVQVKQELRALSPHNYTGIV